MESRSLDYSKKKASFVVATIFLSLFLSSCLETPTAKPRFIPNGGSAGVSFDSSNSTTSMQSFFTSPIVKVIFNKRSFFTNHNTNPLGCAGDANLYYDAFTDRAIPAKPDWLKNVSVDITNSNAVNGPSRATGCSLTNNNSSASLCASFDDLQPLDGTSVRAVLVGGVSCAVSPTGCPMSTVFSDIWHLNLSDTSTASTWSPQSSPLPTPTTITTPGLVWAAGDFDEIHNQFFTFGGAVFDSTTNLYDYSSASVTAIVSMNFNSDGTLSTSPAPSFVDVSTMFYYGNWKRTDNAFSTGITAPTSRVGSTFTYAVRRDPTMKSWCRGGDTNCGSTAANTATTLNEHHDYFLLIGGAQTTADTSATLSSDIYMYKPHGFSNDVGTSAPAGGDWTQLSNNANAARASIMSIVDISSTSDSSTPFSPTFVASTTPSGTTFNGFLPRAFHRTVYDPGMNRFYVFGGLTASSTAVNVASSAPDVSSELWIYDPPALGKRPTAGCYASLAPDTTSLPASSILGGTNLKLGPNRNYMNSPFVFPPGGCLQRVGFLSTRPSARFEHAMAFSRNDKAMLLFGGCNSAATIAGRQTATAGDPASGCTGNALLNDTWVYFAPTQTEFVPQTYRTSITSPYNASTLLRNIFGTDFWVHFLPYFTNNNPDAGRVSAPNQADVMGAWVKLAPSQSPTKRHSAHLIYDRAHNRFYLFGGFGCTDSTCANLKLLNDLWEYSPPNFKTSCSASSSTCNSQGSWTLIKEAVDANPTQPAPRKGSILAYSYPQFSSGDEFYTVNDTSCIGQGSIATFDAAVSKQFVGSIYVDIDRNEFESGKNLLINLKFLPFDKNTKLAGFNDNNTIGNRNDDADVGTENDTAIIRVQLLNNALNFTDQIMALIQPRFHNFIANTAVIADTFLYLAGATGQLTERQILVPLGLDTRINLVKIERVQGSVKFYEMIVSKY